MKKQQISIDKFIKQLQQNDPEVGDEVNAKFESEAVTEAAGLGASPMLETIVLTQGRPVLDVKRGEVVLEIAEIESQIWRERLSGANDLLADNLPAVGRIELANHPRGVDWLGTGWLLEDNYVVTNRHVAEVFADSDGSGFRFRTGLDGTRVRANIDFLEEFDSAASHEFPLFRIVHIEKGGGPDLAFLRIEPVDGHELPEAVSLSSDPAKEGDEVAVIGYPARDPFFPNPEVMDRIFDHRYDKKRLAPGKVIGTSSGRVFHDCTTLGGNSGGEVVSLASGQAVALHFAGTLFTRNHAVPADIVAGRLDDVRNERPVRPAVRADANDSELQRRRVAASGGSRVIDLTIPIRIHVEVGEITSGAIPTIRVMPTKQPIRPISDEEEEDDDLLLVTEARPEDYDDRDGYNPDFLGSETLVSLPELTRNQRDILTYELDGQKHDVLPYRHFSVLMSSKRRLCFYSACNINGLTSKKRKRKGWRFDPRIPSEAQILKECYGNLPKFSRGHMARREDPIWGSDDDATQGNVDSMHATNAVPQLQPFNAGIWLDLEDYALDNAREDDMRISVITGPLFSRFDPIRFGVKIPTTFWKVIAFVHDETGELTATGYTMSQKTFLDEQEFVFAEHENRQRPIAEIEHRAGISFGGLAERDPLAELDESTPTLLSDPGQIRWR